MCQSDTENISVRPSVRAGESAENKFRLRPNGRCTACVHHPQQQKITDGTAAVEGGERTFQTAVVESRKDATDENRFVTLKGRWKAAKGAVCQWKTIYGRLRCTVTSRTGQNGRIRHNVTLMTLNFDPIKYKIF